MVLKWNQTPSKILQTRSPKTLHKKHQKQYPKSSESDPPPRTSNNSDFHFTVVDFSISPCHQKTLKNFSQGAHFGSMLASKIQKIASKGRPKMHWKSTSNKHRKFLQNEAQREGVKQNSSQNPRNSLWVAPGSPGTPPGSPPGPQNDTKSFPKWGPGPQKPFQNEHQNTNNL